MPNSEKDTLAEEVAERRATFNLALSNKRKYPQEFRAFVQSARRYFVMTKNDPAIQISRSTDTTDLRSQIYFGGGPRCVGLPQGSAG